MSWAEHKIEAILRYREAQSQRSSGLSPKDPFRHSWLQLPVFAAIVYVFSTARHYAPALWAWIQSSFSRWEVQIAAVAAGLVLALVLFELRSRKLWLYSLTELAVGACTMWSAVHNTGTSDSSVEFLKFCGAVYVVIRGLVNLDDSKTKQPGRGVLGLVRRVEPKS